MSLVFGLVVGTLACRSDAPSRGQDPVARIGEASQALTLDPRWVAGPGWPAPAVLALNSVQLSQNSAVVGDVSVLDASPGPTLAESSEGVVGIGATLTGALRADTVFIKSGGLVVGSVGYNGLTNNGTIQGATLTPLALPLAITVPAFPIFSAGAADVELAQKEDRTLAAGSYATITLRAGTSNDKTVLTLLGGVYNVQTLNVGDHSRVECAAACEVRIKDKLLPGANSYVGPSAGSGLTAANVLVFVEGGNGGNGNFGATPRAATLGLNNTLTARLYAPNGTLHLKEGTVATGTFVARDVDVGQTVHVTKEMGGCPPSCDDGNPCTADTCTGGACTYAPLANGTACNDGNACTQTDTCQAGVCTGSSPVTCTASDACHVPGSCDPATGACSNPAVPNGTACNDGNACTQSDSCQGGACTGSSPVVCTASDACHVAGTCDPATGFCSNPEKPNGTLCDDGNACTRFDACVAGVCTSSINVMCPAADACHEAGVCNPATGLCAIAAKSDGTLCDDNNPCTTGDACHAGLCGGLAVVCGPGDACHMAGVCNTMTGQCVNPPKPNGSPCSDGNLCTQGDVCNAGTCTGVPVLCTALDACHANGVCDPATGACSNPLAADGKACNDLDACTQTDVCVAGTCTGSNPVTCMAQDACHVSGTCDHATGACTNPAAPNGTACNDGNACTQGDSCQAGICTGGSSVVCVAQGVCRVAGTCDPMTGACSNPAAPDGTACSDGNECTQVDTCQAGACNGASPVACAPSDACHSAGACDPATGACSNPPAANGTACNDGNACTEADTCQGGTCTGGSPVACSPLDACHVAGSCDPLTGACSNPAAPDGTACSDANACTTGESCKDGACGGGTPVTCAPVDACHTASCDPLTGACAQTAAPNGGACDDGNPCTAGETCQSGACGGGTVVATDDANPCTVDACDAQGGVTHTPVANGTPCADGDVCNGAEACQNGTCTAGTPLATDDGDPATLDGCDPVVGVQHFEIPELDRTVATTIAAQARAYYTGVAPLQRRLDGTPFPAAPKPFDDLRVAIVHGRVTTVAGAPIAGVRVTVVAGGVDDPASGVAFSRANGAFELVVDGGRSLTVHLAKGGYLSSERTLYVPVQDHARVPEVALVAPDPVATEVELDAATLQAAAGSVVEDADGARRAVVLVPAGTRMSVPDGQGGSTELLGAAHLRITEYTVGPNGPRAMPAALPPTSAYTYAFEVGVEEAGDAPVSLNQPVAFYVENFLGFPVGTPVPLGVYDRAQAAWIALENGRVIQLVGLDAGGLALVDGDGDGLADDALGLSEDERAEVGGRYAVGQKLWRLALPHFSQFDPNFPGGFGPGDGPPPPNAPKPGGPGPKPGGGNGSGGGDGSGGGGPGTGPGSGGNGPGGPVHPKPHIDCGGSGLDCENQTLHESVPVVGCPFDLHYASDRAAGRTENRTLWVPLSEAMVPPTLRAIALEIDIAGRHFAESLPPSPNQAKTFVWDGKDNLGRRLQGAQPVTVRVGYVYDAVYMEPAAAAKSFGQVSTSGASYDIDRANFRLTQWRTYQLSLGSTTADASSLGGLTVTAHHSYDPSSRTLWLGDGTRRSAEALGQTIRTVVGGGVAADDGAKATDLHLSTIFGMAVMPNGDLVVADDDHAWRVGNDGLAHLVPGAGPHPVCDPILCHMTSDGVAAGSDGTLYFLDATNNRVVRLRSTPGAEREVIAGGASGSFELPQDAVPATSVRLGGLSGLAVAPDGTVYFSQHGPDAIRMITPDGMLRTVSAEFVFALDVAPDGALLATGFYGVRRFGPDGQVSHVFGLGQTPPGDGVPAVDSGSQESTFGVATFSSGAYVFTNAQAVFLVDSRGLLHRHAGTGIAPDGDLLVGEGGPAVAAAFGAPPRGLAVHSDGSTYVSDGRRVYRIEPALPGLGAGEIAVPSADGTSVFVFSGVGRHLRTVDARTGGTTLSFSYDAAGRLAAVADDFGNASTFAFDDVAHTVTISAPHGQATTLARDAVTGMVHTVTSPAGDVHTFGFDADGLLTSFTDARSQTATMSYYPSGRLHVDVDAAGGTYTFGSGVDGDGWTVTKTGRAGQITRYHTAQPAGGGTAWRTRAPDGTERLVIEGADLATTTTEPNGDVVHTRLAGDPRFGLGAGYESLRQLTTPAGRSMLVMATRSAQTSGILLQSETNTVTVNGETTTTMFDRALGTLTRTSPTGRTTVTTLDAHGRVVGSNVPGLSSTAFTYELEHLATVAQAGRTTSYAYDAAGNLASVTDALSQTTSFGYDLAGRRTSTTRPDGEAILTTYDPMGNATSVTPPGQPAHVFTYTPVNLVASYSAPPPAPGELPSTTTYAYDLDRKLTGVTRPDGSLVAYGYDAIGRLQTITHASLGVLSYAYDPQGRLATIGGPDGVLITRGYDGHLLTDVAWSGAITGAFHRDFDHFFRPSAEKVNGAPVATFEYDADGLLVRAGDLVIEREPATGRVMATHVAGGQVTDSTQYDPDFGLVAHYAALVGGNEVYAYDVTGRDALGRITTKTERTQGEVHTWGYGYDLAGRLVDVWKDGNDLAHRVSHYDYDANGNRLAKVTPGETTAGSYDAQDRIKTYGSLSYTFTANGELATKTDTATGDVTEYTYDARGNLKRVVLHAGAPGQKTIDYVVDGLNHRMWKKVDGVAVKGWLWRDALAPVAELDGAGNVTATFVYGGKVNVPEYVVTATARLRVVTDHLGSPHALVDEASGAVVMRADYDEFGNVSVTPPAAAGMVAFGFAGGIWDPETGLVRFGARDYEPTAGRWTAKDPLRFPRGGTNRFGYCAADPVNEVDPRGTDAAAAAAAAAGAGMTAAGAAAAAALTTTATVCGVGWLIWQAATVDFGEIESHLEDAPPEKDCNEVKGDCIKACEGALPTGDYGFKFWNCVNKCVATAGC